jgi:hypothetical protein
MSCQTVICWYHIWSANVACMVPDSPMIWTLEYCVYLCLIIWRSICTCYIVADSPALLTDIIGESTFLICEWKDCILIFCNSKPRSICLLH